MKNKILVYVILALLAISLIGMAGIFIMNNNGAPEVHDNTGPVAPSRVNPGMSLAESMNIANADKNVSVWIRSHPGYGIYQAYSDMVDVQGCSKTWCIFYMSNGDMLKIDVSNTTVSTFGFNTSLLPTDIVKPGSILDSTQIMKNCTSIMQNTPETYQFSVYLYPDSPRGIFEVTNTKVTAEKEKFILRFYADNGEALMVSYPAV